MKFKYVPLLFFFTFKLSNSQEIDISVESQIIIYTGIHNPIKIHSKDMDCSEFSYKCTDGELTNNVRDCKFYLKTSKKGYNRIQVFDSQQQLITTKHLYAIEPPFKVVLFAPQNNNGVKNLKKSRGFKIRLDHPLLDIEGYNGKMEYEVVLIRGDRVLYREKHYARRFTEELRSHLRNSEIGDILLLTGIYFIPKEEKIKIRDHSFKL